MNDSETASLFDRLRKGMEESIAHSRGELTLKTTTLPIPPPPAKRSQVIALRKKLKMSQSVFAAAMNVSTKLVQAWEQGKRTPDRADLRLLQILSREPEIVNRLILGGAPERAARKAAARKRVASAA